MRTVVDTGSRVSITSDGLAITTGGTYGDPGYWAPACTRAAGKMLVIRAALQTGASIGWDSNQAGAFQQGIQTSAAGILQYDNGGGQAIADFLAGGTVDLALILRATGMHVLIRSELYPSWELVWTAESLATATLYPTISPGAGTVVRFMRVPSALWLPVPVISDGFGSAFGTSDGLGHAETSGLGAGGAGVAWTQALGTWGVSGGKAVATALDGGTGSAIAVCDAGTADVNVLLTVTRSAGHVGAIVRYADASNYIRVTWDGTNWYFTRVVAGSETQVQVAGSLGRLRVHVSGDVYRIYSATTLLWSGLLTDSALLSGTKCGLYTTDTGNTCDNFQAWSRK